MANQKPEAAREAAVQNESTKEGWVSVFVEPGTGKDKGTLYVCVNGKGYYVPRGKAALVPPEIAEVLRHRTDMMDAGDSFRDNMSI